MFVTISARTYYQSSSWPNIIVAVNSYQKTLNKTDLSRVPTSKPQAKSLPNMTSLWRSTFFSMESLFNCSATLETIHSKITSHLLKAKTWKTRERLVSLLRDLRLLVLWKITSKTDGCIVQMTHLELTSSVLWICNKKRSNRRVLGKCGSSKNRRKNCRNHKTKSEEPWYAPTFFAHWKIITGTSLQSHWKTTENTKKDKGGKILPLPQRGRRGYHEQQEPWRPEWHKYQKPSPLSKACAPGELKATHAPSLQPPYGKFNRTLKKSASSKGTLSPAALYFPPSLPPRQERRKTACNSSLFWNLGLDSTFSTIPHGIVMLNTILLAL